LIPPAFKVWLLCHTRGAQAKELAAKEAKARQATKKPAAAKAAPKGKAGGPKAPKNKGGSWPANPAAATKKYMGSR